MRCEKSTLDKKVPISTLSQGLLVSVFVLCIWLARRDHDARYDRFLTWRQSKSTKKIGMACDGARAMVGDVDSTDGVENKGLPGAKISDVWSSKLVIFARLACERHDLWRQ